MRLLYAGTDYCQVIQHNSNGIQQQAFTTFGAMQRSIVRQINRTNSGLIYQTDRTIYELVNDSKGGLFSLVALHESSNNTILGFGLNYDSNCIEYGMSDGRIFATSLQRNGDSLTLSNSEKNGTYKDYCCYNHQLYAFAGKGVLPHLFDLSKDVVTWRAKNLPHDQLGLQVPVNDLKCRFGENSNTIIVLGVKNCLKIYDIRGGHRRPIFNQAIKADPNGNMTQMCFRTDHLKYYLSNDVGSIYECDTRKSMQIVGKYKGITTTVTDLMVVGQQLLASSLDGYIRTYDTTTRKLKSKIYFNKHIYSFTLLDIEHPEQLPTIQQQPQNVCEDEEWEDAQYPQKKKQPKKIKPIRKRNKVGLKYLQPRQFDDIEIKQQEQKIVDINWINNVNPVDRVDFQ